MRLPPAAIAFLMLLGMTVPIAAQQVPFREPLPEPAAPYWTATPSPAQLAVADSGENDGTTAVAHTLYVQLTAAALDRSHMTSEVRQAWTPQLQKTASVQLSAFGTPTWTFVAKKATQAGTVSVYRLTYPDRSLYMSVGVTDNGVIYALRVSDGV